MDDHDNLRKRRGTLLNHGAGAKKAEESRRIAEKLKSHYSDLSGKPVKVLRIADEELDTHENPVDAVLAVDDERIAVEFVSYRMHDAFHQHEERCGTLIEGLKTALADAGIRGFTISIHWAQELRRKHRSRSSRHVVKLPHSAKISEFYREFVRVMSKIDAELETAKYIRFHFLERPAAANPQPAGAERFLRPSEFPVVSEYVPWFCVQRQPALRRPYITTSFNVRSTGLDCRHLQTTLTSKLDKLARYRTEVGNLPVWLLLYSDGYPISSRIPPNLDKAVVSEMQTVLAQNTESFDKVWYGADFGFSEGSRLYAVRAGGYL
jgi:hypothetical protein